MTLLKNLKTIVSQAVFEASLTHGLPVAEKAKMELDVLTNLIERIESVQWDDSAAAVDVVVNDAIVKLKEIAKEEYDKPTRIPVLLEQRAPFSDVPFGGTPLVDDDGSIRKRLFEIVQARPDGIRMPELMRASADNFPLERQNKVETLSKGIALTLIDQGVFFVGSDYRIRTSPNKHEGDPYRMSAKPLQSQSTTAEEESEVRCVPLPPLPEGVTEVAQSDGRVIHYIDISNVNTKNLSAYISGVKAALEKAKP